MQLTPLQDLECCYAELYKDVYGVKARWYRATSIDQVRKDIDELQILLERKMAEEAKAEQQSVKDFEKYVTEMCNGDFEQALRWQHQAYRTDGDDEFLCYRMGLPYNYFSKRNKAQTEA